MIAIVGVPATDVAGRLYAVWNSSGPSAVEGGVDVTSGIPFASLTTSERQPAMAGAGCAQTSRNQSPPPASRVGAIAGRPPGMPAAVPPPATVLSAAVRAAATISTLANERGALLRAAEPLI